DVAENWLEVAPRQTPTVRALLVIDMNSPAREVLVYASRVPGASDDSFRRMVLYRVLPDLELTPPQPQLRHLHRTYDGQNYLLSYWQRELQGKWYMVLAWHDVSRIAHEYLPVLYGGKD